MIKKIIMVALVAACLAFDPSAYAHSMEGRYGSTGGYGYSCPVSGKFMKKAHFLLENQSDLGLAEEQVKTIKDLMLQVEKDNVRQEADAQIFLLDLKSKLDSDKVDVEAANALIDKAFSSQAAATKSSLEAYAKLKSVITPDQLAKLKELHKKMEERWKNKDK